MPRLLCVHPHPDDESIACGGLIARALDGGHLVHVLTCTGGEEGENLSGIDLGGQDMATVRRAEMAAALNALGDPAHHWLGYRDSGMAGEPSNDHPEAFHRAELDEAAGRVARLLRRLRPDVVVSDDEQGTYGHPDHVKANQVTVRAVELAGDPAWEPAADPVWRVPKRYVHTFTRARMFEAHRALVAAGLESPFGDDGLASPGDLALGVADDEVTTVVDVRDVLERKRAAMAAHRSQIGEESFFLNVPDELAARLFGTEEYALRAGEVGGDQRPEVDVFAGLAA